MITRLIASPQDDENNALATDDDKVEVLKEDFLKAGKPVLVVDYVNDAELVADFCRRARADRFIPYAARTRGLDRLGPPGVTDLIRGDSSNRLK